MAQPPVTPTISRSDPVSGFQMLPVFVRLQRDEKGAAMVEYGLLLGLIALVVAGVATAIGQEISGMLAAVGTYLTTVMP